MLQDHMGGFVSSGLPFSITKVPWKEVNDNLNSSLQRIE